MRLKTRNWKPTTKLKKETFMQSNVSFVLMVVDKTKFVVDIPFYLTITCK